MQRAIIDEIDFTGYFINELNGIKYVSREVSDTPLTSENGKGLLRHIRVSPFIGLTNSPDYFVFDLKDIQPLAEAVSIKKQCRVWIESHARIIGRVADGKVIQVTPLEEFYDNLTQEEMASVEWFKEPGEQNVETQ